MTYVLTKSCGVLLTRPEEIELASCATGIPNKLFLSRHPVQRMQPERDPLAGVKSLIH